jgi:hypothetical protein
MVAFESSTLVFPSLILRSSQPKFPVCKYYIIPFLLESPISHQLFQLALTSVDIQKASK